MRSLPRAFVTDLPESLEGLIELPKEEFDKFHKVLRLGSGDHVAILPGDGRLLKCELQGRGFVALETIKPATEASLRLTIALGMPKQESLEESVRMATEIGACKFVLFTAERTVVRWDQSKREAKLARLRKIAREAAEVSFRTRLPEFEYLDSLKAVLAQYDDAIVLSEGEAVTSNLEPPSKSSAEITLVIGPEGGWAPREVQLIGDRAVTLGPRVFRVDTAVASACALTLLR